jgi:prepilin-type N-terminal cleavage/methylation domain-containing protein
MRKRGFSLLELLVILAIVSVLLALVAGAISRYRANTALVESSRRLTAEITNQLTEARAGGQLQVRNNLELATTPLTAATVNATGPIEVRISDGSPQGIRNLKQFPLIEDANFQLSITATNLPSVPLVTPGNDTGRVMEVGIAGAPFQRLFTVLINADGTVALPLDTEPARITLNNGNYSRQIEIGRLGKVREFRL